MTVILLAVSVDRARIPDRRASRRRR